MILCTVKNAVVAHFEQAQRDVKTCPTHSLLIFRMSGNDALEVF